MENSVKQIEEVYTTVKKGYDGWVGETVIKNVNGYDWKIHTSKSNKGISSTAQAGKAGSNEGFSTFKCRLFTDPHVKLITNEKRCTEKAVRELHQAALLQFNENHQSGTLPGKKSPEYQIKPGQLFFLDTMQDQSAKLAVYKIGDLLGEDCYHYVNTETLELGIAEMIDDYEDQNGAGHYYIKDDVMDIDLIMTLVRRAEEKQESDQHQKDQEQQALLIERNKKIAEGIDMVTIDTNAVAMIIAEFKEDKSDMLTDYFAHTTKEILYLAYSSHSKDLFSEMRKAALNAEQVKELADAPKDWEHREKYSLGAGYYLGEYHHSGWEIRKVKFDPSDQQQRNEIFIAAVEGRYFCESLQNSESSTDLSLSNRLLEFHQIKHTRKGHDLFVYALKEQVDRDKFLELKDLAKVSHGYYSSFRGKGAVPGFHFLKKEDADLFISKVQ